jgi:hypothetical protein
MTLDGETLAIRSLKPLVPEGNLDYVSRFQDRMLQVELVGQLLRGLYDSFVEERKAPEAWGNRVKEIQTWAKARTVTY